MQKSMSLKYEPSSEPRCRTNMAHIRQSRQDSGLGVQVEVLNTLQAVSSLELSISGARAVWGPFPSEEGTTYKLLMTFTIEPRPDSGLDCLICAEFARQCRPDRDAVQRGCIPRRAGLYLLMADVTV